MENEKIITFSVSEDETIMSPEEIENAQFTKVHFRIYSANKVNDHNYTCSLKILKKYANTISGKPILVWYNKYANGGQGDFAGHEDSIYAKQYPVGFFPNDVKVTYEKDENGTIYLCADGYIWTLYYSEIVKVFENYGGIKGVSSEMLVIESEMIEDTDIENILQYSFAGLTLLGEHDAFGTSIKPAVDGCQGTLVANSSTNIEYEKAKTEFEKILYNSTKKGSDKDSFFNTKNEEESMGKEVNKNSTSTGAVENATQEVNNRVDVSTSTYSYDDDGNFVGSTYENHYVSTTEVKEVSEEALNSDDVIIENAAGSNVVENASVTDKNKDNNTENGIVENSTVIDMAEFEALKIKCSKLETEISKKNADYETLLVKCSELETYKNNKENENMKNAIEIALNSVSHILNSTQIEDWRNEAKKYSVENVDEFSNKLKAFAFDIQEKNGVLQSDTLRNSIPKEVEIEPADLWDRLSKTYA